MGSSIQICVFVKGDLHILSVDATDAGNFKCSKFNPDLGVSVEVKTITVAVNIGETESTSYL